MQSNKIRNRTRRFPYAALEANEVSTTYVDEQATREDDDVKLAPRLPALALIHGGILILAVWLTCFFPITVVRVPSRPTAVAPAVHNALPADSPTEIGYGPLPEMNQKVYVEAGHFQMYHWSPDCPLLHRKPGMPHYKGGKRRYLTRWEAELEGRLPCFHCSRMGLDD